MGVNPAKTAIICFVVQFGAVVCYRADIGSTRSRTVRGYKSWPGMQAGLMMAGDGAR
jgi:hypothetical protein